jgi:hypothetical protein
MSYNCELRMRVKEKSEELYNALLGLFDIERGDPAKEKVKQDAQELARGAIIAIWGRVPHLHDLGETSDDIVEKMYPELQAAFVMVSLLVDQGVRKPPPLDHAVVVAALKKLTGIWPLRSRVVRAGKNDRELGEGRNAQPEPERDEEISAEAEPFRINKNWMSLLRVEEDEGDDARIPRQGRSAFDRSYDALTPDAFVYRANRISGTIDTLERTFINDLVQDGLLYTNDFRFTLKKIEDYRKQKSNLSFCDRVISAMVDEHGQLNCWRGLYFFLLLRDCLRMQYRETVFKEKWRLSVITRVRFKDLPVGRFWPDLLPQDGASAAVHVVRHTDLAEPIRIPANKIQIWFGEWTDLAGFDTADLQKDYEALNVDRILVPCERIALEK